MTAPQKEGFCTTNKCMCIVLVLVAAAIGAVVAVTFAVPSLRSKVKEPERDLKWWQKTIVYQIYPRSFQDSDGDGVGDLQGIKSRLYYFKELGVDAIWLSPFYTSPMKDFGYDVANYTDVDPLFGTMKDFEEMIKEAHKKDIKVIVDFVPNHSSDQCEWFKRSRKREGKYADYYIWSDGKNNKQDPPNNWQSVFDGTAWTFDTVRKQYFYHAFLDSQPDLNYRNPEVRKEITSVVRFWCDKGVDGFRIDAIPHMFEKQNLSMDEPKGANNGFDASLHMYTKNQPEVFDVVKEWKAVLDEYEEKDGVSRFLVAETAGISHDARLEYYKAGSVPFFFKLLAAKSLCKATPQCLLNLIKEGLNFTGGEWPNFVIGNHDNHRIATQMGRQYVDVMNMLLLTLPGTPTTYYGEELGMHDADYTGMTPKDPYAITSGKPENSRDPERSPMQWNKSSNAGFTSAKPWIPLTYDYTTQNVEVESADDSSHLSIYKGLAEIRRRPAFQSLNIDLPDAATDVLVYVRGDNSEQYVVAMNLGTKAVVINLEGYGSGTIELSTMPRSSRQVAMNHVYLRVGEGLIIKLD